LVVSLVVFFFFYPFFSLVLFGYFRALRERPSGFLIVFSFPPNEANTFGNPYVVCHPLSSFPPPPFFCCFRCLFPTYGFQNRGLTLCWHCQFSLMLSVFFDPPPFRKALPSHSLRLMRTAPPPTFFSRAPRPHSTPRGAFGQKTGFQSTAQRTPPEGFYHPFQSSSLFLLTSLDVFRC